MSYTGEVDELGRPDGFGYWKGDLWSGERIVGYWKAGIPDGPSKSREVASGSGFMCIKLGWARCSLTERRLAFGRSSFATFQNSPRTGVCSVECSVSGRFFRGFPAVASTEAPMLVRRDSGILHHARRRLKRVVNRESSAGAENFSTHHHKDGKPAETKNRDTVLTKPRATSITLANMAMSPELISLRRATVGATSNIPAEICPLKGAYVDALDWVMSQLYPHTPSFGLQTQSEVTVSVDRERGVDILGFVPESQVLIESGGRRTEPGICQSVRTRLEESDLRVSVVEQAVMKVALSDKDATSSNLVEVAFPELKVHGWLSMDSIGVSEVLIYVHGYNNSEYECQQTLGQMAAFGNFPTHLKIIVFTWPAGRGWKSFFSARKNAEDPICHEALRQLFACLQASGIRQIHILVHSMGARLFLKALRLIVAGGEILATLDTSAPHPNERAAGKLQLVTVTLMNPEYFLDEFVLTDYKILRRCCAHITIYADAQDQALLWSEIFSRREALGRSVFRLHGDFHAASVNAPDDDYHLTPQPSPPEQTRRLTMMHTMSFFHLDAPSGVKGVAKEEPFEHIRTGRRRQLWKYWVKPAQIPQNEKMDLDVIDTTYMDRNVHAMRHSFWNLNREIIEDLREILVTRKRARQRTGRLDRRDGNVWVYRVAPSFLTSIFEGH